MFIILCVMIISGCTSLGVKENEYNGVKHFEGKGISFNAPNTWHSGSPRNTKGYLFSIYQGTLNNSSYIIDFYSAQTNKTLSEAVIYLNNDFRQRSNCTVLSEKNCTVNGVAAYQVKAINSLNQTLILTYFVKDGVVYSIDATPNPYTNHTNIESDLEMVINTFHPI